MARDHVPALAGAIGATGLNPYGAGTLVLLLVSIGCVAQDVPRVPCRAGPPSPNYAAIGDAPNVATWKNLRWEALPECLPWPSERFRLIVAVAGRFRDAASTADLLTRFGAISAMRGTRYWSESESTWRTLIEDASALGGPDARNRRADFTFEQMKVGNELFYLERDNRSGDVVYRMRVLQARANRIVVATENVTPVRALGFTLFPPGTLRAAYFVEKASDATWSFYGLTSTSEEASVLAGLSEASYVNRATALYRHFTGRD